MSKPVYLFLDEGGNFDFSTKGSKYFTITSLTSYRPFPWTESFVNLKYDLMEKGRKDEHFHATEDFQPIRNEVFKAMGATLSANCVDSIIIDKRKTGPALQNPVSFYSRMIGYLLQYVFDPRNTGLKDCTEIIVVTDSIPVKQKRSAIEKAIKITLAPLIPSGKTYTILHHSSKSSLGLQAVDYVNWAIFKRWESNDLRSYKLIMKLVRSEYHIFASGMRNYY